MGIPRLARCAQAAKTKGGLMKGKAITLLMLGLIVTVGVYALTTMIRQPKVVLSKELDRIESEKMLWIADAVYQYQTGYKVKDLEAFWGWDPKIKNYMRKGYFDSKGYSNLIGFDGYNVFPGQARIYKAITQYEGNTRLLYSRLDTRRPEKCGLYKPTYFLLPALDRNGKVVRGAVVIHDYSFLEFLMGGERLGEKEEFLFARVDSQGDVWGNLTRDAYFSMLPSREQWSGP